MNCSQQDIAIVIPIYKEKINSNENVSLERGLKTFKNYTIIYVAPRSLDVSFYSFENGAKIIRFDDKYFKGISGYNALMLDAKFYKKFYDYKYMLIYQLDAYVFRDELLTWCQQGYDYIGAPWIVTRPSTGKKPFFNLSNFMLNKVGNGGFSLRKIQSHYLICKRLKWLLYFYPKNEDFWWGVILDKIYPRFKKPTVEDALKFAFELAPQLAYEKNNRQLPFGCHAWEKYDLEFWREFIPELNKKNLDEN